MEFIVQLSVLLLIVMHLYYNKVLLRAARTPRLKLFEEVVALVINQNECGEVLNMYLPNGFHTKFGVLNALDTLDRVH